MPKLTKSLNRINFCIKYKNEAGEAISFTHLPSLQESEIKESFPEFWTEWCELMDDTF